MKKILEIISHNKRLIQEFYLKHKEYLKFFSFGLFFIMSFMSVILFSSFYNSKLEIIFLDIGQGDSILIKTPENNRFLIDSGANFIASQKITKYLPLFSNNLDAALLTHPDLDHVGGTEEVIKTNNLQKIYLFKEDQEQKSLNIYQNIEKDYIEQGNIIKIGNINLNILWPSQNSQGEDNYKSIVSSLRYSNFEYIFLADVPQEVERILISSDFFQEKTIKILKVSHHGSKTGSSEMFLKKIKPQYCIISVGKNNKYGHPDKEIMNDLEKYCKVIYRTDEDGDVITKTDGENFWIDYSK